MTPERRNELLKLYSRKHQDNHYSNKSEKPKEEPRLEPKKEGSKKTKEKGTCFQSIKLRDDQVAELKFLSYEAAENMSLYVTRSVRMRKMMEAELKQGGAILLRSRSGEIHELNINYLLAK